MKDGNKTRNASTAKHKQNTATMHKEAKIVIKPKKAKAKTKTAKTAKTAKKAKAKTAKKAKAKTAKKAKKTPKAKTAKEEDDKDTEIPAWLDKCNGYTSSRGISKRCGRTRLTCAAFGPSWVVGRFGEGYCSACFSGQD